MKKRSAGKEALQIEDGDGDVFALAKAGQTQERWTGLAGGIVGAIAAAIGRL